MQIKSIAMLVATGCVIGLSTGCIKQEDLDNQKLQLTNEKEVAVAEVKTQLADKESLLNAEQAKTRKLQIELNDSAERLDELKSKVAELTDSLDTEKSNVSRLESSLSSSKAQVSSAQQKAVDAENAKNVMEIEKQETQRRFDMLRKALIDLNNIKPANLGIQLEGLVGDMGAAPTADDMGMGSAPTADDMGMGDMATQPSSTDADSVKSLLDDMENM